MLKFILFISCIHFSSSQITYNSNPYSAYYDPSHLGPYNIEYPTNQFQRRIHIPGVETFRPSPYSYLRNVQSNGTTSSESWNQEGPTKYSLFSYPTRTFQDGGLVDNSSPSAVSHSVEMVNSWSQIPVYLTNPVSTQTNSPELISRSYDISGYPYTTRNIQLLKNQNTDSVFGSLSTSNRGIPSRNPIALPYSKLATDSPSTTAKNPLLYYYKNPRQMSNLTLEMSPSIEPSLGSIVSPYLTRNTNSKHSSFQMVGTDLEMLNPTNNKYTTNYIQEPNTAALPYQLQNIKSDSIRQSLPLKESNPTNYYQNTNQNAKSIEANPTYFPNQKTTFGNVDSLMSHSLLETINPIIYYSTDDQNYNPVGTVSYLIQKTSSLNDQRQRRDLRKSIDNTISIRYPQNSKSAKGTNNWKETIEQSKEKYSYKDNPNSETGNSSDIQSKRRHRRGVVPSPYRQGYSEYNTGYNTKFQSTDHGYTNMYPGGGYNMYPGGGYNMYPGGGYNMYPGGNKYYGMGYGGRPQKTIY